MSSQVFPSIKHASLWCRLNGDDFFLFKTSGFLKIDPQKIILRRFEKCFTKKKRFFSQKRYFSNGNPMQNRWCGSNIRKFHHRSGNFRSCLEAARYRTSWAARCEFFNDLKSTINLRLVSFQNVAPHSLGCREQKLVHMDMVSRTDLVHRVHVGREKIIPDTLRHNSGNSALYVEAFS